MKYHPPDEIIEMVCRHYRMEHSDFAKGRIHRGPNDPRAVLSHLLRQYTLLSDPELATMFGCWTNAWYAARQRFRRLPREEQLRLLRPFIELEHPHCAFEEIGPDEWCKRTPRVAHEEAA